VRVLVERSQGIYFSWLFFCETAAACETAEALKLLGILAEVCLIVT